MTEIKIKKTILIDLDGVLNYYDGKYNSDYIPPIREDAIDFIKKLSDSFEIKLFTARNLLLASKWVIENGLEQFIKDITNIKEPAWLYVDDRCINFDGNFDNLTNNIYSFEPWHKAKI